MELVTSLKTGQAEQPASPPERVTFLKSHVLGPVPGYGGEKKRQRYDIKGGSGLMMAVVTWSTAMVRPARDDVVDALKVNELPRTTVPFTLM